MYQVRVLVDNCWKVLPADTNDSRYTVLADDTDANYLMIAKYSDAANLFDRVQLRFHKNLQQEPIDNISAIKLVKVTPSGREISVESYKDLIRRK